MKLFLLILVLFVINLELKAQDSLNKRNNYDSSIKIAPVKQNGFYTYQFESADHKLISKKVLKHRLLSYEPSAIEFRKYKTSQMGVFICAIVAVTSLSVAKNAYDHNNMGRFDVLIAVGLGSLAMEIINFYNTPKHFNKALSIYNKQFE